MIIALHGFGSTGMASSTCRLMRKTFENDEVLTPTWHPDDPVGSAERLVAMIDDYRAANPSEEIYVVGTSFGGFMARYVAHTCKSAISGLVLLNPVIDPEARALERLGANESFVPGGYESFMTHAVADVYRTMALRLESSVKDVPTFVLLGTGDAVLPWEPTARFFDKTAAVEILRGADHRLTGREKDIVRIVESAMMAVAE